MQIDGLHLCIAKDMLYGMCSADEQLLTGDVLISAEKWVDANLLKYSDLLDGFWVSGRQRSLLYVKNYVRVYW